MDRPSTPPAEGRNVSTGAKVLLGCAVVFVLGTIGIAVVVGVGGFALKRGVDVVISQADDHQEATRVLERLERSHRFQPPADGAVAPALRRRFAAVTERAWPDIRSWAEEARALEARSSDRPDRRANLGDMRAGVRAAGGMVRSRVVLAQALSAERVSLSEYVWTGQALLRSAPEVLAPSGAGQPDGELVLNLARVWARAEGLATLESQPR